MRQSNLPLPDELIVDNFAGGGGASIGMRMLQPHELYAAQGFPTGYVHDHGIDADGNRVTLTKTTQVRMCGNSVCPPLATVLVELNFRHEQRWQGAA